MQIELTSQGGKALAKTQGCKERSEPCRIHPSGGPVLSGNGAYEQGRLGELHDREQYPILDGGRDEKRLQTNSDGSECASC